MSILPLILASAFGAISFLFIFWKRLKEDYAPKLIFDAGFIFVGCFSVFSLIFFLVSKFSPDSVLFRPSQMWFWGGILGILTALRIVNTKLKLKVIETFEAVVLGTSFWLVILYVLEFISLRSQNFPILALISAGIFLLFFVLDKKYKSFNWYHSGKVGFSGLVVSGLFFLFRVIYAYLEPTSFSVIGRVDVVLSAVAAFLIFFSLYNLSES